MRVNPWMRSWLARRGRSKGIRKANVFVDRVRRGDLNVKVPLVNARDFRGTGNRGVFAAAAGSDLG